MSHYAEIRPQGRTNLTGCLLRAKQIGMPDAGDFTLNTTHDFTIQTQFPAKVELRFKLTSGTLTAAIDVNSTGTYSSSDSTSGAISTTAVTFVEVETTAANDYACVRLTGSSAVIAELEVKVLGVLAETDNGTEVTCGFNAIRSADGTWDSGEEQG